MVSKAARARLKGVDSAASGDGARGQAGGLSMNTSSSFSLIGVSPNPGVGVGLIVV